MEGIHGGRFVYTLRLKSLRFQDRGCAWLQSGLTRSTASLRRTNKEREVPVPAKLIAALAAWKEKSDESCGLVFPTSGCNPKLDFLDCLKAVAKHAGLNPKDFILHRFRATFATWHLRNGVDLRTVQSWMGHSDLESTIRYLKPNDGEGVHAQVNGTFA